MNTQNRQKRVMAIHDISGFGRCSLTVALPIISACGIETVCLPTAVLSTHTGGFEGYTYNDLTADILPIFRHWAGLGIEFDAIYSGFLGSFEQIDMVGEIFSYYRKKGTLIAVDPVMADNGELYKIYSPEMAQGMARLCADADLVMPNITEASFILGREYREPPYDRAYIEELLRALAALGPKKVVLTGVCFADDHLGAASLDTAEGEVKYAFTERIDGYFHGTGDVFGSALVAAVLKGKPLSEASRIAAEFTCGAIKRTVAAGTDRRNGVDFEEGLVALAGELGVR